MRLFLSLILVLYVLGSCVPNKRIVYLQNTVEPKTDAVTNRDSTSRVYSTAFKEYTLKPGDIVSINIGTLTPSEFNFIQKYEEDLGLYRKLGQYDQATRGGGGGGGGGVGGGVGGGGGGGGGDGRPSMSGLALDQMPTGFTLDEKGGLDFPKLGRLELNGLTIPEAEKTIKDKLLGFFDAPLIRVQLLNFHFTILGEVKREGRYTLYDPNATLIDALTVADNLNEFADRSKIKIIRFHNNNATVFYVNILKENLLEQPGFYLKPNDLIIVPPLEARETRQYTLPTYTSGISLIVSTLSFLFLIVNLTK